eukprot:2340688-Prymnesium_polylepis.1
MRCKLAELRACSVSTPSLASNAWCHGAHMQMRCVTLCERVTSECTSSARIRNHTEAGHQGMVGGAGRWTCRMLLKDSGARGVSGPTARAG